MQEIQQRLKNKLIFSFSLYFMIFMTFVFLGLGLMINLMTNNLIFKIHQDELMALSDSMKESLSQGLEDSKELIYAHSLNHGFVSDMEAGDFTQTNVILSEIQNQSEFFDSVFISDKKGIIIASNDSSIINLDISSRAYFNNTVILGMEKYVTEKAIQSQATGHPVIVYSSPLKDNFGNIAGMLAVSMDLGSYGEKLIASKKFGETGYSYVVDQDGFIVIHSDPDLIFFDTSDWGFIQEVNKIDEEEIYYPYTLQGISKQAAFHKMENPEWMVVTTMTDEEVYSVTKKLTLALAIALIVALALMDLILIFLVKSKITNRLYRLEQLMSQAADGKLHERGLVEGKDELSLITTSYNSLIDSMGSFFKGLHGSMADMDNEGNELASNMEETAASVQQIQSNIGSSLNQFSNQKSIVETTVSVVEQMARNIESQDDGIDRQNNSIAESSSAIEELIAQIQGIAGSTEEAEKCMSILVESSRTGQTNIQKVAEQVATISEKSHDLEEANKLISGIAAQTNLLAMNAAIEAAHAGSSGKGFAVVADEIRKLAEQSTKQSTQVKQSIKEINQYINDVVDGSDHSSRSFEDIQVNIDRMSQLTGEIRSSMEEQNSGGSIILNTLNDVRDIATLVKSGSREMTQGNQVILDSVGNLTDISYQLNQAMEEIENGIKEINQSVINVLELSERNKKSIEGVRSDARRYET